ncbi:hypothetical protein CFP56_023304 [Quercus suber]|uniref:Uncharacterized protein n=1 Tax=Quercus suber TaxID=58331 RepID=A0AAW0K9J8_QUESU
MTRARLSKNGQCPKGTIPIRREQEDEFLLVSNGYHVEHSLITAFMITVVMSMQLQILRVLWSTCIIKRMEASRL